MLNWPARAFVPHHRADLRRRTGRLPCWRRWKRGAGLSLLIVPLLPAIQLGGAACRLAITALTKLPGCRRAAGQRAGLCRTNWLRGWPSWTHLSRIGWLAGGRLAAPAASARTFCLGGRFGASPGRIATRRRAGAGLRPAGPCAATASHPDAPPLGTAGLACQLARAGPRLPVYALGACRRRPARRL